MAVSPGPASTVLRFLRGGCGQDGGCLCGRLCEPCRRGDDSQPSEGTVGRVTPERVILTDGRVFRRPGGSAPRPGQKVIVDHRPGLIARTPYAQPHIQQVDTPAFVPPLPSYETAQRPSNYGKQHIPENDAADRPKYVPDADYRVQRLEVVSDSGELHDLGNYPATVDHQQRVIRLASYLEFGFQATRIGSEYLVVNTQFWSDVRGIELAADASLLLEQPSESGIMESARRIGQRIWHYDDASVTGGDISEFTQLRPGMRVQMQVETARGSGQWQTPQAYRFRVRKVLFVDGSGGGGEYRLVQQLQAYVTYGGGPFWVRIAGVPPPPTPGGRDSGYDYSYPYPDDILDTLPAEDSDVADPTWGYSGTFTSFAWAQEETRTIDAPPEQGGTSWRWRSPDGRVTIDGPQTLQHNRLRPSEVIRWPGGSLAVPQEDTVQSWGAYRNAAGMVLLIFLTARNGTVTRVDVPDEGAAVVTTVTHQAFSEGVLGANLLEFDQAGPMMNTWPPQHVLARVARVGGGDE